MSGDRSGFEAALKWALYPLSMLKTFVLSIKIKKEVELLALLAFVGSIVALGWQGWNALRGPEVAIAPVRQIVIYVKTKANNEGTVDAIYIAAPITLYNIGAPGYGDFVIDQYATLRYGNCTVPLTAQNVVTLGPGVDKQPINTPGTGSEVPRPPAHDSDWLGFAIEHGGAVSRSIEFSGLTKATVPNPVCMLADRFTSTIGTIESLSVRFGAMTVHGDVAPIDCRVSDLRGLAIALDAHRVATLACDET